MPTEGLMLQVTGVLDVPVTVAVNCWVWEFVRATVPGLVVTETEDVTLSTPSEVVSEPALPSASASTGFESWSARFPLAVEASVIVTTAATPFPIAFMFWPVKRQVEPAQYRVLPAAVAAAPATVVTDVVWSPGTFKVH